MSKLKIVTLVVAAIFLAVPAWAAITKGPYLQNPQTDGVVICFETDLPGTETIRLAVIAAVALSIVAHGLTAQPGIARYAHRIAALDSSAPAHREIGDESREPPAAPHSAA